MDQPDINKNMPKPKKYYIGVKAAIVKNGKVLLVENVPSKNNRFSFPGGKIDEGESIEKALKRELKEELNINSSKIIELLDVFERFDYKKGIGLMLLIYKVKANTKNMKVSNEHIGFRWIDKKEFILLSKDKKNFHSGIEKSLFLVL